MEISRKLATETLDLEMVISEEEIGCRFEGTNWISHATHMVNSRQGMVVEFYSATCCDIGCGTSLDGVGTIEINTIPCMCTACFLSCIVCVI